MGKKNAKQGEMDLLRCLQIAAHRRASALGISSIDYLIGILEGTFPKITADNFSWLASVSVNTVRYRKRIDLSSGKTREIPPISRMVSHPLDAHPLLFRRIDQEAEQLCPTVDLVATVENFHVCVHGMPAELKSVCNLFFGSAIQ